jgi:hypothetical protein
MAATQRKGQAARHGVSCQLRFVLKCRFPHSQELLPPRSGATQRHKPGHIATGRAGKLCSALFARAFGRIESGEKPTSPRYFARFRTITLDRRLLPPRSARSSLLIGARPRRPGARPDVQGEGLVGDRTGPEEGLAALHDRFVLLRRSLHPVVRREFRKAVSHEHEGETAVRREDGVPFMLGPMTSLFVPSVAVLTTETTCHAPTRSWAACAMIFVGQRKAASDAADATQGATLICLRIDCLRACRCAGVDPRRWPSVQSNEPGFECNDGQKVSVTEMTQRRGGHVCVAPQGPHPITDARAEVADAAGVPSAAAFRYVLPAPRCESGDPLKGGIT